MSARIYTADEAQALLEESSCDGGCDPAVPGDCPDQRLRDAASDLAATVVSLAAERDALAKRMRNAEAMRDAFVATSVAFATDDVDRGAREVALNEAVAHWQAKFTEAAEVGLRSVRERDEAAAARVRIGDELRAARAERDAAIAHAEELTRALRAAQAIVEGRPTTPTHAEALAHERRGGTWLVARRSEPGRRFTASVVYGAWPIENAERVWALDAQRRPCAWPTVAPEVPA